MPYKPPTPCAQPGCPNLTHERFCDIHKRKSDSDYDKYQRTNGKRYGRAWKRIRDRYAAENPFCEKCLKNGVAVHTEEIHHILPLSEGGNHSKANLIALCKSCHSEIHALRGDRWHNQGEGAGGYKNLYEK